MTKTAMTCRNRQNRQSRHGCLIVLYFLFLNKQKEGKLLSRTVKTAKTVIKATPLNSTTLCRDPEINVSSWCIFLLRSAVPSPLQSCDVPTVLVLNPSDQLWNLSEEGLVMCHQVSLVCHQGWQVLSKNLSATIHSACLNIDAEHDRAKLPPYNGSDPTSPLES